MKRQTKLGICRVLWYAAAVCCAPVSTAQAGPPRADQAARERPHATSKSGKNLFGAEDAGRLRGVNGVALRLSPDGTGIAFTASETVTDKDDANHEMKSRTQLWVTRTGETSLAARQFTYGKQSVSSPSWSANSKQIAFLRGTEDKESERQVWLIGVDGGEAQRITAHKGGWSSVAFSPDGQKLLLSATDQGGKDEEARKKQKDDAIVVDHDIKMSHVWIYDMASQRETRLTEGDFTVSDLEWSPDGARISFTANPTPRADDGDLSSIWIVDPISKEKHKLLSADTPNRSARWSPDGQWIAYLAMPQVGGVKKTDLYLVAAAGGNPRKLTGSFDNDVGVAVWSRDGKTIYFSSNTRETNQLFAVDLAAGSVRQITQARGSFSVAAAAAHGEIFGTWTDSGHPAEIAKLTSNSPAPTRLTDLNHFLGDYALGETEVATWKSTDGTEIDGVLYKPVDYDASKKYPLLLNPHGGPTGASTLSFNATAQILAANGYLVLQPNFRGSTGRGEAFAEANHDDWGGKDYQDCISGVKSLVARGVADPDRLGAFGWSYGGYMTFWILTQTDMFKAVSPGAGLTNLAAMYSQHDIQRYLRWFFDDKSPWDNEQAYWDHSPMKFIKSVKTPTLILQGQADTRVPMAQAQEFYRALLERNVPVEFVLYPRENHGFIEPKHIEDRYRRYLTFFGKYLNNPPVTDEALKPEPVAAPAVDAATSGSER